jgi:hypothetical protein
MQTWNCTLTQTFIRTMTKDNHRDIQIPERQLAVGLMSALPSCYSTRHKRHKQKRDWSHISNANTKSHHSYSLTCRGHVSVRSKEDSVLNDVVRGVMCFWRPINHGAQFKYINQPFHTVSTVVLQPAQ